MLFSINTMGLSLLMLFDLIFLYMFLPSCNMYIRNFEISIQLSLSYQRPMKNVWRLVVCCCVPPTNWIHSWTVSYKRKKFDTAHVSICNAGCNENSRPDAIVYNLSAAGCVDTREKEKKTDPATAEPKTAPSEHTHINLFAVVVRTYILRSTRYIERSQKASIPLFWAVVGGEQGHYHQSIVRTSSCFWIKDIVPSTAFLMYI